MNDAAIAPELRAIADRIAQGHADEAIAQLQAQVSSGAAAAEHHALLGTAYFTLGRYAEAESALRAALGLSPGRAPWSTLLEQAEANRIAEAHVAVPPVRHYDREALLRAPVVPPGAIPPDPLPASVANPGWGRVRRAVGQALGRVATALMEGTVKAYGALARTSGEVWTTWYRRPLTLGVLTLAHMREGLNAHNLKSTYPEGTLIGFQPPGQTPPPGVQYYRTADGSWNNLDDPKEGAAGTRFSRNIRIEDVRPESGERLLTPNPREISLKLLTRGAEMKEVPFLNMLAAAWIQFQNADWINHGENLLDDTIDVPLPEGDPARATLMQSTLHIPRTQPDPTRVPDREQAAVTFVNEVTHWWDGSQIYGSDQATVDRLRSGVDGKLALAPDGTLPLDERGVEQTGFVRNWWVGMSLLHTLFAREHNAICDHLKAAYPDWDDTRLFNVARLVNAAVMAKIHSVEWTPAILPNRGLDMALNANWYGILTNLLHRSDHRKTVAPINVANPELGGVVGNPIDKHGTPYALAEEFVEVYRLHSLLPETLAIRDAATGQVRFEVPFAATRQAGAAKLVKRSSLADLLYSFGNQHPGQLVLNNYPRFMQALSIPGHPLFDMGAVDIVRARERGVPRYNEFRRQLGLKPIRRFEDLTDDDAIVRSLKDVYGDGPDAVESLDLLVGTLGEGHRPDGFGFGETMFQIFILNATRRLQADRFYTDCYTEEIYTKEGMAWIDRTDLKTVILRHFPELAASGLANVKNAFEPWDAGERLDPARHPLRGWDKSLQPDPWRGDAARHASAT